MTELTVTLPDDLAQRLSHHEAQLPRIIECGFRQVESASSGEFNGVRDVPEQLASLPSPRQVLEMQATADFQPRAADLPEKNRLGTLTDSEARDLSEFELTEHIIRLAKGMPGRS